MGYRKFDWLLKFYHHIVSSRIAFLRLIQIDRSNSDRPESGVDEITMNGDMRRIGSRRVAKSSDCPVNFVKLVEEKWSGEVKFNSYGISVVFTDVFDPVSSQSGPRHFSGDFNLINLPFSVNCESNALITPQAESRPMPPILLCFGHQPYTLATLLR